MIKAFKTILEPAEQLRSRELFKSTRRRAELTVEFPYYPELRRERIPFRPAGCLI